MILLISTCKEKLCENEFVTPVARVCKELDYEVVIKHYTEPMKPQIEASSHIIICGTALADNAYLEDYKKQLRWIKHATKSMLGICSGMQIIGMIHNAKLIKKKEIGMTTINTVKENSLCKGSFEAYTLHQNALSHLKSFHILAESKHCPHIIKHRRLPLYGVMFHPEVRNTELIKYFLQI